MSSPLMEVTGFKELEAKIRLLADDKDKRKEVLIILRQVAKPTLQAAKAKAPIAPKKHYARDKLIAPGNLKKSLGYITGKQENPTIYVGPRAKGSNDGWYGHFVEYGHNVFNQRKSVFVRDSKGRIKTNKVTGALRAKKAARLGISSQRFTEATPFMAQAHEATKGPVTADAEKRLAVFIQRRIDKLSN